MPDLTWHSYCVSIENAYIILPAASYNELLFFIHKLVRKHCSSAGFYLAGMGLLTRTCIHHSSNSVFVIQYLQNRQEKGCYIM